MRALAALRMVWASAAWMAVEMLATWCVRKLRGDARPSPYRVLSVAPVRTHDEPAVDVFALRQNPKTRSYIVLVGILP
jgi:hypothetical protein